VAYRKLHLLSKINDDDVVDDDDDEENEM